MLLDYHIDRKMKYKPLKINLLKNKSYIKVVNLYIFLILFSFSLFAQTPFREVSKEAGIDHVFKVFEGFFGGGACVLDYNNDGFEDIFLAGGMGDDKLYKNNGNGTFTDVYVSSGLTPSRKFITQSAVAADVNRDGFVDIFICTISTKDTLKVIPRAENLLFINNGNGTFRDATKEYGLADLECFTTGASFGDINADGFPDLYVGNYFTEYQGKLNTISDATIVGANQIAKGHLLLNISGKKFENVYEDYGLKHKGFGFGGVFTDYDNDGDQDLIVNHDFGYKRTPNLLLENRYPLARFANVAEKKQMDLRINAMASAVGDYNNDGLMDYFFTNIRFNYFMVNSGKNNVFENKIIEFKMDFMSISWGANFADFDHDSDLDLFVANGDLNPNCTPMGNFYFENNNYTFKEEGPAMGLNDYGIGRGSVVFDMDNDGDLDILVVNQTPVMTYPVESRTKLFRNDLAKGNWVKIKLKGLQAESYGIGSRVEVIANGKKMVREIDGGGSSHLSQNTTFAHFGLGDAKQIEKITVYWTGGKQQVLTNQKVNSVIVITESPEEGFKFSYYWLIGLGILVILAGWWARKQRN
ncbi:Repeat domain-containing protein [Thermoflexibacter ruber]|uniref:Repeat domain-containing protein n=2 Tax=Thermoflexibacter ruber TaxID=1003 RepID=A0A1I2HFG0_9BACT|nr:Repeat domain-containing protein [Thermoflexibacter ruber]